MLRRLRIGVVATVVALGGVSAAQAAVITIGTLGLFADVDGLPFIEVANNTTDAFSAFYGRAAAFSNVTLTFASDAALTQDLEQANLGNVQPGGGVLFVGFDPAFLVPPNQQAFAALNLGLEFVGGGTPAGQVFVNLLDVSGAAECTDPDAGPCAQVLILYETARGEVPVPEPATLALLTSGLGTIAVRRLRRR